jgi:hypothetical protein
MINNDTFSMDNLSSNPNFDFIHNLNANFNNNSNENDSSNFFDSNEDDNPYASSHFSCNYFDIDEACVKLNNAKCLSVFSLNIQSLPAKFNEFKELIEIFSEKNCKPDVILLQEIWQIHDCNLYMLSGYHPLLFKCRLKSQGGGGGHLYKGRH